MTRPPLPPFDAGSAAAKVRAAEDAWNSRDPERVSLAYTVDTEWRNRSDFVNGRAAVVEFLRGKWVERPLTIAEQISAIGNSVCPPVARALVAANQPSAPKLRLAA